MISAFIAAQPKSASTHLCFALGRYLNAGYGGVNLYLNNGVETQDIHPPTMQSAMQDLENFIVKPHVQATPNNVALIAKFGLKPIVTTRNIYDTIVSMKDHFDHICDPNHVEYLPGDLIPMPLGFTFYQDVYTALEPEDRMEYVIDYVAPWVLMFQHSWSRVEGEIFRLDYDQFMANKAQVFMEILNFLGHSPDDIDAEKAEEAVTPKDLRYNKAVTGRGEEELLNEQKTRIDEIASRIGIAT